VRERSISIPHLVHVGDSCLGDVARLLESYSFDLGRVCVASGAGPSIVFADKVVSHLRDASVDVITLPDLQGRLDQAAETAALIIQESVSLIVGVGGGRVIDTVKLAAARSSTEFISIPTTLSHDGISSPVASLFGKDGQRRSYAAAMPAGIILDLRVVGSAPVRTLRSGVGDLASNLIALLDWQLADRVGLDRYDAFSALIAESASRPVLDLVDLSRPESHEILAKGLLLSGLAMAAAGTSRPCSGAEHLISHSLDELLGARAAMHGEQVALGCLVAATAHDSPLLGTFQELFRRLALPVHPLDLAITQEEMLEAVRAAPATRPERYTVLSGLSADRDATALLERAFPAVGSRG
jgi:glycerol-1-phosphate dehydrogenase [NAD(P)+]